MRENRQSGLEGRGKLINSSYPYEAKEGEGRGKAWAGEACLHSGAAGDMVHASVNAVCRVLPML